MQVEALKTQPFLIHQDFEKFLIRHLKDRVQENQIVAITSKVVSLAENRLLSRQSMDKDELVRQEADVYLGKIGYDCHLTIKCNHLIASAGIDESNSENGDYILYPQNPFASAKKIHGFLKQNLGLKNLGVLLTDSRTQPLRMGVTGTALAHYGFRGIRDKVGDRDLFGRELKMTRINVADSLAAAATLLMGEGNECCPLALLTAQVEFVEQKDNSEMTISLEQDLYWPLIKRAINKK